MAVSGTPVPSNSVILSMGQEELVKWLRNCKLTEYVNQQFNNNAKNCTICVFIV